MSTNSSNIRAFFAIRTPVAHACRRRHEVAGAGHQIDRSLQTHTFNVVTRQHISEPFDGPMSGCAEIPNVEKRFCFGSERLARYEEPSSCPYNLSMVVAPL
ncbi:hypothetical protein ABH994_006432 [Bradyrhizobium yuanmingense]|uniref:Uncharacterized protein n=1 Tax=Bradyrhizobium yuanmingense TaxID=108015 RepID=A0ABV4GKI6_9BRAD